MATKPAKRKPAAKKAARPAARAKAPAVESAAPAKVTAPAPAGSSFKRKAITWGVVLAVAIWLWGPSCKRSASQSADPGAPASPAAPVAAPSGASPELKASWGPKFSLKEVSSIKAVLPIQEMVVDGNGTIYAATLTELIKYQGGKEVKRVNLGGGAYRNLALSSDGIYVTYSDNNSVALFSPNLDMKSSFAVEGGRRTLSLAALGKGKLAFCEVDGDKVYLSDAKGKAKAQPGILAKGDPIGMVYDMKADGDTLYINNTYARSVMRWSAGKATLAFKEPCSAQNMRKVALSGGNFYCGCAEDDVIVKIGMDGKYKGFAKFDRPVVLTNGADGFLYVHDGSEITKLQP
jgi:hypothetical protein